VTSALQCRTSLLHRRLFVQLCKRLACPGYNGTKLCARCRDCQKEKAPKGSRRLVDHNNQPLPPGRTYFVWDCNGTGQVAETFRDNSEEMEAKDTHKLQAWHEVRDKEIRNVPFQQGDPPKVFYVFIYLFFFSLLFSPLRVELSSNLKR